VTGPGADGRGQDSQDIAPDGGKSNEGRGITFPRPSFTWQWALKVLFLGGVNAFALYGIAQMWAQRWWPGIVVVVLSTLLIDWAYLSKRALPAKYLVPGTIFALIFQVIPVIYSGYIALTNFSTDNRLTEAQTLDQITSRVSGVPGSTRYRVQILQDASGAFGFFLTDEDGNVALGTSDGLEPLAPGDYTLGETGRLEGAVKGFSPLSIRDIADVQEEIERFEVPADVGVIQVVTLTTAAVYEPLYEYDAASGELTDIETGVVYRPLDGRFTSEAGETIQPGWQIFVGFENFTRILTAPAVRGPFLRVFLWNYAFAILSVVLTFVVGLGLAVAMNHPSMRGKKVYRSLLIIPYALPSFMTALIWAGMLNQEFGIINELLGADIAWLRDPWMAKASVLLVNTWLGFPYMFLISTGALQAIPEELKEAAIVDGATAPQSFRRITFPLLMVSLAPLLIASFAFNFNNFNIIYLLNRGGPPIEGALTPAGHTDILISYTFRLAFESGRGAEWGFASSIAILIFLMVATISAISFRRTRALEELA
jgi:arabinogalactan oligomer/maltooligosaccharide transport system permease protein